MGVQARRELIPHGPDRPREHGARAPRRPVDGLLDLEFAGTDGVTRTLGPYLEESYTDALVVLHDGAIAGEWLRAGVAADETHIVMSVSKSITALLAGALEGAGLLDHRGPVAGYIPEAEG